jgi:hypothetical protein
MTDKPETETEAKTEPITPITVGEIFDDLAALRLDELRPLPPTLLDADLAELTADPDLAETWDMGPPSDPPDIRGLDDGDAADKMAEWFLTNFDNPAEDTPWDEGEYVYIWGGPYKAREELEAAFETATETAIEAALKQIEEVDDSWEWAPAALRMQPEEPRDALVAAKQRLMRGLERWRLDACADAQLSPKAEFDVRDIAMLLRALYQLQLTTCTGGAHGG